MMKRELDMTQVKKALLLASVMIAIALLAVFEIVPDAAAQWAPLALLAIFPGAWLGKNRQCAKTGC